jgi:SAM-dependent methyltransferase
MPPDTPSPDSILRLGCGAWAARALHSAVRLDLFTRLSGAELDGEALAERLSLHPRGARDYLDALVSLGLLERRDGLYRNAPGAAAWLDRGRPGYLGELVAAFDAGETDPLTDALRTGRASTGVAPGADDALHRRALGRALAERLLGDDGDATVVDLGCGAGGLLAGCAETAPGMRGIGFDAPHRRAGFEAAARADGLDGRLSFVPGDVFADAWPDGDVLVLAEALPRHGLEEKHLLLARAHAALRPGGKVAVLDAMIDDGRRAHVPALLASLAALARTPAGFAYTAAECARWLRDAGFRAVETHAAGPAHTLVTALR